MAAFNRKYPAIISAQPLGKIDELMQSKNPVRWWYATEGRRTGNVASLISTNFEIDLTSTVVIVDISQSNGYPLESVASYISMIAFAQIKGSKVDIDSNLSILGLFNDTKPRIAALRNLTVWDRAYLHALYKIAPDRPIWQQRKRLSGAMAKYIQEN